MCQMIASIQIASLNLCALAIQSPLRVAKKPPRQLAGDDTLRANSLNGQGTILREECLHPDCVFNDVCHGHSGPTQTVFGTDLFTEAQLRSGIRQLPKTGHKTPPRQLGGDDTLRTNSLIRQGIIVPDECLHPDCLFELVCPGHPETPGSGKKSPPKQCNGMGNNNVGSPSTPPKAGPLSISKRCVTDETIKCSHPECII